ncbi:MAG: hypothetical protein LBU79_06050 [Planctomycetota bacterium]|nr:hypothetical protein [Planctomycetota bacterium]
MKPPGFIASFSSQAPGKQGWEVDRKILLEGDEQSGEWVSSPLSREA